MSTHADVRINQSVAILIDGNNIERGLQKLARDSQALLDFDRMVPKLLQGRGLKRLIYFREGISISDKLAERLLTNFHGSVVPCHKSADIPLTIMATQIAQKVDTIIILSGDSDYVELVRHLKGEGVRVEIAAVEHATAKILVDEVEHFTPINLEDCYILKVPGRSTNSSRSTSKRSTSTAKNTTDKPTTKPQAEKTPDKPKRAPRKTRATNKAATSDSSNITEKQVAKSEPITRSDAKKTTSKSNVKKTTSNKTSQKKSTSPEQAKKSSDKSTAKGTTSKSTSTRRKPVAKSIKELEKETKKPMAKRSRKPDAEKKDDWDDLSF